MKYQGMYTNIKGIFCDLIMRSSMCDGRPKRKNGLFSMSEFL